MMDGIGGLNDGLVKEHSIVLRVEEIGMIVIVIGTNLPACVGRLTLFSPVASHAQPGHETLSCSVPM